jgi:hypothetical protein
MSIRPLRSSLMFAAFLAMAAGAQAGTAEVRFVQPEQYTDAGGDASELARTQVLLEAQIQALARQLPAGQRLQVEVLDVDLAGIRRPFGPTQQMQRVVNGGADSPSLTLRYTLADGSSTLASGESRLTDLNYLSQLTPRGDNTPLRHEQRMLAQWFAGNILLQR